MPVVPLTKEVEVEGKTLSEKQTKSKITEGVDPVVEGLPCKHKALSSIHTID
jgi:hypothetical protein